MKALFITLGVVVAVVVITVIACIGIRNGLIDRDEKVREQWSQIETQLQRRADLIPNLVNTVKGYASHEQNTLSKVVEARAQATQTRIDVNDAAAMARFAQAQGELSSALSRLMAISESYPDLKASQNFRDLQTQLEGTENRIAVERRKYNEAAQSFNTYVKMFPRNLLAGMFGFAPLNYFEAQQGAEKAPEVQF